LLGTSYYKNQFDVHDYGNTAPLIGPPFAHTPWSPQTRDSENKCQSPYYYFDKYWQGLRRTHWMSGSCTIDYGSATIIPSTTASLKESLSLHKLNHNAEVSSPSNYRIMLEESSLLVEAASDIRAGIMKISPINNTQKYFYLIFKGSDSMYNQSSIRIISNEIDGTVNSLIISNPVHRWYQSKGKSANFSGHHFFRTSRSAVEFGIIEGYTDIKKDQLIGQSNERGTVAAYLKFESSLGSVTVATGTSFINPKKAEENLYSTLSSDLQENFNSKSSDSTPDSSGDLRENLNSKSSYYRSIFDLDSLAKKIANVWEVRLNTISVIPYPDGNASLYTNEYYLMKGSNVSATGDDSKDFIYVYIHVYLYIHIYIYIYIYI
jgi:putative alpha-1,2-mannosidase